MRARQRGVGRIPLCLGTLGRMLLQLLARMPALSEELGDFLDTFPGRHDHLSPARGSFARIRGVHREAETHSEVL